MQQFLRRDRRRLHLAQIPLHDSSRLCDVRRIAGIRYIKHRTGLTGLERRADGVHQTGIFPEITIEPGRIKCSGKDVHTKLDRIVIRILASQFEGLAKGHFILDAAAVGNQSSGPFVARHRREIRLGRRPRRFPFAEIFFHDALCLLWGHLADNDNGCKVGTKNFFIIGAHVLKLDGGHGIGRRLTPGRIVLGVNRLKKRPLRKVNRTLKLTRHRLAGSLLHGSEGGFRQPRMQ